MVSPQQLQTMVDLFNQQSKSSLLLTRKCSDLKENKHYVVHSLKKTDTTVGDAVLVTLSDSPFKEGDLPKFQVFLPKRFVYVLQNENLETLRPGMLYLVSHGCTGSGSTELSLHLNDSL